MTATTDDFLRRAHGLIAGGVREDLAYELRWCGNINLIAEVERASDAEIADLNAAYGRRQIHSCP